MTHRIVVTGGAGFVGQYVARALAARGDSVLSLDAQPHALPGVECRAVDLRNAGEVQRALDGAAAVIHSASVVQTRNRGAAEVRAVNVGGTQTLLRAAREAGASRFVYVSSASVVYEGRDINGGDETMPYAARPPAVYAATKIEAERQVLSENGVGGLLTTAIRPHVIFGPGDTRFLPAVLGRAREGKLKAKVGLQDKLSDFTYIDNLVAALLAALDRLQPGSAPAGQAYFVTNGEPMAFFDFVGHALARAGLPPVRRRVPFAVAYGVAAAAELFDRLRGGDIPPEDGLTRFAVKYLCTHHWFCIDKARRDLGYVPRIKVLEGLDLTLSPRST